MSELMTVNDNRVAVQSSEASMAMQIMNMASNPEFDVEKLEKLMDLQEREMSRLALVAFNQAFAEMQSQIPTVAKSKKGGDSNYATSPPHRWLRNPVRISICPAYSSPPHRWLRK